MLYIVAPSSHTMLLGKTFAPLLPKIHICLRTLPLLLPGPADEPAAACVRCGRMTTYLGL